MKKNALYKLESGVIKEHPAMLMWNRLKRCNMTPRSIERLEGLKHNKSNIYRLNGIGKNGSNVIAKHSHQNRISHEQIIYEKILPQLPISKLYYYGVINQKKEDDWKWLFIEEAKGAPLNKKNIEHRVLASKWLAKMHLNSLEMDYAKELPKIETNTYFIYLDVALKNINVNISRTELKSKDIELLQRIIVLYSVIKEHWNEIEEICSSISPCLAHSDFYHNNVRVCHGKKGLNLFVFDWELSGWGTMAEDLCSVDTNVYWSIVKDTHFIYSLKHLQQISYVGIVLRCLAEIYWISEHLNYEWIDKMMKLLPYHENELSKICKTLRWS